MSDINALQSRLEAALDRIKTAVDTRAEDSLRASKALQAAVETEKSGNASLKDQNAELTTQLESLTQTLAKTQSQSTQATESLAALDLELQKLRQSVTDLSTSNEALRNANAQGVADPDLINSGLKAELDALRAMRAADIAEVDTIISNLTPLLHGEDTQGGANA